MKKNKIVLLLLSSLIISCNNKSNTTEKYPDFFQNIVDVSKKLVPIKTEVLLGQGGVKKVGSYLLFNDWYADDNKGFVFFDKKTLKHVGYGGKKGQGPGEIIKYKNVHIMPNERDANSFFAFDYSSLFFYKYTIDSLLNDKSYLPQKIIKRTNTEVLGNVVQLNDSIFLGMTLCATSYHTFVNKIAKLNIKTGKTESFGYQNPYIRKLGKGNTHSHFNMSVKNGIYVQSYFYQDLITFCDEEGNLICNIYGKKWKNEPANGLDFYSDIEISSKYVFIESIDRKGLVLEKNKAPRGAFPKKIRVFDLKGNYIKTLDFGEELRKFCVDEETNRIFVSFLDRDEPLGYLDLKGILD